MARNDVVVRFRADTRDAEQGMDRLANRSRGLDLDIKKLALGAGAATAAFTGLAMGATALVKKFQEQERAEATLAQVVGNTGAAYAEVEQQILSATAALQSKTNFGDEAQIQALTKMTLILGDVDQAMAALPTVLDASAVSGRNLNTVAETLTKALAGQANTAESLGMVFDKAAGFGERLQSVQEAVGGSAEASADPFIQLGNAMGDFQETLGALLAGPLVQGVQGLTGLVGALQSLVDWLAASDVKWDENGKRIVETSKSVKDYNAVIEDLVPAQKNVVDIGDGWVRVMTDAELRIHEMGLGIKKTEEFMNFYWQATAEANDRQNKMNEAMAKYAEEAEAATRALEDLAEAQAKAAVEQAREAHRSIVEDNIRESVEARRQAFEDLKAENRERQAQREAERAAVEKLTESWDGFFGSLQFGQTDVGKLNLSLNQVFRLIEESGTVSLEGLKDQLIENNIEMTDMTSVMAFLEAQGIDVLEMWEAQQGALRKTQEELRRLEQHARAAAAAMAAATGGHAGIGPTRIAPSMSFIRDAAMGIFPEFDARELADIGITRLRADELGTTIQELFLDFFLQQVMAQFQSGMHRADALLKVLMQFERLAGAFDAGGVVPGPRGSAQLALVHGGETILPTHRSGSRGGDFGSIHVHNNFSGSTILGIDDLDQTIRQSVRDEWRKLNPRRGRR